MSQRIVNWLAAGAVLAATGSAFGYPATANSFINVTAPVITVPDTEHVGPLSRVTFAVLANGILTAGQNVDEIRLVGLNSAGVEVAAYTVPATDVQGGAFPPVGVGGAIANIQLNLNTTANDDFLYNPALGITSFGLTVSDAMSANTDAGRVASRFNSGVETGMGAGIDDECFAPDSTPPRLVNGFIQGANFFGVFDEPLNLTNGAFGVNVAANETTLAGDAANADFQYIAAPGPFAFVDTTPQMNMGANTGSFGASVFVGSNNSVINLPIAVVGNFAIGGAIRPTATGGGVTSNNAITDIVGNRAVQASPTTGVAITDPPTFAVQSVEWVASYTNLGAAPGAQASTLRVTYTLPIGASLGNALFYQGNNAGATTNLRRGGADSDLSLVTGAAPAIDPTNPAAVLVSIGAAVAPNNNTDNVWADGRDTPGNQFTWNYNTAIGALPADIFGTNLGAPPATALTVADRIVPTQQYIGFGDRLAGANPGMDGKLDATVIAYDEPVTTNATTGTFSLAKVGATVQPVLQIAADGTLTNDTVVADVMATVNAITPTAVAIGNGPMGVGVPTRIQMNNAVVVSDNPDTTNWDNAPATAVGGATEAIPGNGGPSARTIASTAAFTVTDTNTNVRTVATFGATAVGVDVAAPFISAVWFLTGDNQDAGDANQYANEQDGATGDQTANNRLVYVGSEAFGALTDAILEEQVRFGAGGVNGFPADVTGGGNTSFGGVGGTSGNLLNLINSAGNAGLVPGVLSSILPGSGITDAAANETTLSDTAAANRTAPYIPLVTDVNGAPIHSAFLEDTDADGFANQIRLTTTQPINEATVQVADFTLSLGAVGTVAVQGNDIVLGVTDNVIPMTSVVTVTYNSTTDAMRIASLTTGGGTGASISNAGGNQGLGAGNSINNIFNAQRVAPSNLPTQELAFMDIVGAITRGTTPVPAGTKIYAMIAAPHIYSVTATHNNVTFTQTAQTSASSINAWNRWLFGVQANVYLGRSDSNVQTYENFKDQYADDGDAAVTFEDTINLTINASSLTNITFTGTGETSVDKVANGRALLCWDVLRATGGLVQNFFNPASAGSNGPQWGGQPILSSAVITGTNGQYELHVSAPVSIFNGASRLNSVDRPVILIVEEPNGNRFAVSSVLTSINGAPVRFRHQSRSQTDGEANSATTFNVDLNNVGAQPIYSGWNLVGNNRNSGFATTTGTRPVRVNGVSENAIIVPGTSNPALPFTGALEQFVYFADPTVDGMWTRSENGSFSNIVIDPDCFPHFAFTMTSLGVQAGSSINNFVGGYALGFFNPGNFAANLGCFQFGAPLTGNTLFSGADAATTFPNNATTQGWGLFTNKAAFSPATGIGGTNNPDLDYLFTFRNNGPNAVAQGLTTIEVSSLDLLTPTGSDPNDTAAIGAGQPFFGHWLVP